MDTAAAILHAVADRFLVNIQTDVVHIFHGGASLVVCESAGSLSSAFLHQALLHRLIHSNNPPTTVVCLSQGPSLTVEHVENVVEMRCQSHHVLDSVPLLAGASRAEKSSAGGFAGVCNHARSVRERKDSSSPYRALSVDAVHRKNGRFRRAPAPPKLRLALQRLILPSPELHHLYLSPR